MIEHIIMPKLGESITEGTIVKWVKNIGQTVKKDENIVIISTDKVEAEIPSPIEGTLLAIHIKNGETTNVGTILGEIGNHHEDITKIEKQKRQDNIINENNITKEHNKIKKTFLSPLVLNIMKLNNLSTKDIIKIKGSGNNGRITKKDILHFVKEKNIKINKNNTTISTSYDNNKLITKMSPMRKSISEHMIASKQISAHVTTFFDVDYTKINLIKNKYKKLFFQEEEVPLTYTVFLVCAVSQVLKRHKYINASIKKNHIIFNNNINLGIAVFISSPDPGLIVPVIKNCDQMNLRGIANAIYHLSKQARKNKTSIESLSEATFTISNPGNYGSITGTPIINQPQVAILGIGKIKKRLTITEINKSDVISIKNIGIISLSFDHRLIDGVTADIFMSDLKATLENWTTTP